MKKTLISLAAVTAVAMAPVSLTQAENQMLVPLKRMTMETALRIAKATIKECRKRGVNIAVTVVDRNGIPQVTLRDTIAPDITISISKGKAHAAAAFNAATSSLVDRFKSGSGVGKTPGLIFSAGGVPIQAGGTILGGVGVSGAPSGKTDEDCARAGVKAVQDDLEMAG